MSKTIINLFFGSFNPPIAKILFIFFLTMGSSIGQGQYVFGSIPDWDDGERISYNFKEQYVAPNKSAVGFIEELTNRLVREQNQEVASRIAHDLRLIVGQGKGFRLRSYRSFDDAQKLCRAIVVAERADPSSSLQGYYQGIGPQHMTNHLFKNHLAAVLTIARASQLGTKSPVAITDPGMLLDTLHRSLSEDDLYERDVTYTFLKEQIFAKMRDYVDMGFIAQLRDPATLPVVETARVIETTQKSWLAWVLNREIKELAAEQLRQLEAFYDQTEIVFDVILKDSQERVTVDDVTGVQQCVFRGLSRHIKAPVLQRMFVSAKVKHEEHQGLEKWLPTVSNFDHLKQLGERLKNEARVEIVYRLAQQMRLLIGHLMMNRTPFVHLLPYIILVEHERMSKTTIDLERDNKNKNLPGGQKGKQVEREEKQERSTDFGQAFVREYLGGSMPEDRRKQFFCTVGWAHAQATLLTIDRPNAHIDDIKTLLLRIAKGVPFMAVNLTGVKAEEAKLETDLKERQFTPQFQEVLTWYLTGSFVRQVHAEDSFSAVKRLRLAQQQVRGSAQMQLPLFSQELKELAAVFQNTGSIFDEQLTIASPSFVQGLSALDMERVISDIFSGLRVKPRRLITVQQDEKAKQMLLYNSLADGECGFYGMNTTRCGVAKFFKDNLDRPQLRNTLAQVVFKYLRDKSERFPDDPVRKYVVKDRYKSALETLELTLSIPGFTGLFDSWILINEAINGLTVEHKRRTESLRANRQDLDAILVLEKEHKETQAAQGELVQQIIAIDAEMVRRKAEFEKHQALAEKDLLDYLSNPRILASVIDDLFVGLAEWIAFSGALNPPDYGDVYADLALVNVRTMDLFTGAMASELMVSPTAPTVYLANSNNTHYDRFVDLDNLREQIKGEQHRLRYNLSS